MRGVERCRSVPGERTVFDHQGLAQPRIAAESLECVDLIGQQVEVAADASNGIVQVNARNRSVRLMSVESEVHVERAASLIRAR
ncbi:hypothetical protein [Microlunatus soli]|uniref:hypothetical protein n=1 Tax=Microlunatus soli TaxID=630515 RepID=UPI0012F93213|nr:hypothetical protein [Microlunatus soli]